MMSALTSFTKKYDYLFDSATAAAARELQLLGVDENLSMASGGIGTLGRVSLQTFQWSGNNSLFISCGTDHITIGGDNLLVY